VAKEWINVLRPYIKHMHINDNDLKNDLHKAIGQGNIDYKEFTSLMTEQNMDVSVLVEVSKPEDQVSSLKYMKKEGIYPLV